MWFTVSFVTGEADVLYLLYFFGMIFLFCLPIKESLHFKGKRFHFIIYIQSLPLQISKNMTLELVLQNCKSRGRKQKLSRSERLKEPALFVEHKLWLHYHSLPPRAPHNKAAQ